MRKYQLEWLLFTLAYITFSTWLFNLNYIIPLIIYGGLFIYFIYKDKPFYYFLIVTLFSTMSCTHMIIEYCLIVFLFFYVLYFCIKEKKLMVGKLLYPILLYFIYNALSLLWTPVLINGLMGLSAILEGFLVYFIITNKPICVSKCDFITISKISSFIMLTLTLEIIAIYSRVGLMNILENKNLLNLGWGISNLIAVIYVFLIPIALYKYLNLKKFYLFYLILDLLNILGLFLTLSRGAYLGVFISVCLFSIFYVRKKIIIKYGGIIILLAIVLIIYKNTLYTLLTKHIAYNNFFYGSSRGAIYHLGWQSFLSHPIFGRGIKSSEYMINTYLKEPYAHYHNFLLQIAATLGIVGLILFSYIIYNWVKILNKPNNPFIMCVLFSIIGSLTHQLVDVSFDLFFFGAFFYMQIGLVEIIRNQDRDDALKIITIKNEYR